MIVAQFIGKHGSLGLTHGDNYRIEVVKYNPAKSDKIYPLFLKITSMDYKYLKYCPYTSLEALLHNWKIVNIEKYYNTKGKSNNGNRT